MDIPERYEDITAEWLTEALRSGGVIGDQTVSTFQLEPLGADRSLTSSLARITVGYDRHADGLPDAMFVKFASRNPENRKYAADHSYFRREIELYKNLGGSVPLNMPRMYFGLASEDSDVALIVLEEINGISKGSLPPEERPLTAGEAKLALKEIAKMHAKWWEDQTLHEHKWLNTIDGSDRMLLYQSYEKAWARIKDVLEPTLSPDAARICNGLSDYLPTLISKLKRIPTTLCHGDFHSGNLLWDKTGEPDAVWIIDWQITSIGPAILDVSFLMCFGVSQSDLPFVRNEYLLEYHNSLVRHGVTNYGYEKLLSDYRYGLLDGLARLTAFLSTVDFAQNNVMEFASSRVGAVAAAAEDAGCAGLISIRKSARS